MTQWIETSIEMDTVNWQGEVIHLEDVPAIQNKENGHVRVLPEDISKAELREIAKEHAIEPRDIRTLSLLIAKPEPFQRGFVQYKYAFNKMLFYIWKKTEEKLGDAIIHDEFEAKERGPVPVNLGADLERLQDKGLVRLKYHRWGKGEKQSSLTVTLTEKGEKLANQIWNELADPFKTIVISVKDSILPKNPDAIKKKVHREYPKYALHYTEPDLE